MDAAAPFRYKARPRVSVGERRGIWKRVATAGFKREAPVTELELAEVHNVPRWRMRRFNAFGSRICFLVDSQETVTVAARGRSSSRRLNHILRFAAFRAPLFAYTYAEDPADAPSRAQRALRGWRAPRARRRQGDRRA